MLSFVNFNPDTPKHLAGKLLFNTAGTRLVRLLWLLTNNFFYQKPWHLKLLHAAATAAGETGKSRKVSLWEGNGTFCTLFFLSGSFWSGRPQDRLYTTLGNT